MSLKLLWAVVSPCLTEVERGALQIVNQASEWRLEGKNGEAAIFPFQPAIQRMRWWSSLLVLTGCPRHDETDSTIPICNNVIFSITHMMREIAQLTNPYGDSVAFVLQTVLSNSCNDESGNYLDYFANVSDTIPIYFFHTDTLKAYPWAAERDSNKYLEKGCNAKCRTCFRFRLRQISNSTFTLVAIH
jgi:hypothetical protein